MECARRRRKPDATLRLVDCFVLVDNQYIGARGSDADATRHALGEAKAAFAVENLAGRMTVVAGDGDAVVAVATVRAESEALASAMRFEQVRDKDGLPTLRVIYPLDRERRIRYPEAGDDGADSDHRGHHESHWFFGFLFSNSEIKYDDRRVRVGSSSGTLLYADVEVTVPRRAVEATFRNFVGALRAEGLEGRIVLDTSHGAITARRMKGDIKADTGSSDVLAEAITGSFVCDTAAAPASSTASRARSCTATPAPAT